MYGETEALKLSRWRTGKDSEIGPPGGTQEQYKAPKWGGGLSLHWVHIAQGSWKSIDGIPTLGDLPFGLIQLLPRTQWLELG